jgi:Ca2+-binding RTX toxin-like protein
MRTRHPSVRGTMRRFGAAIVTLVCASAIVGLSAVPASAATCSGDATMTIDLASDESVTLSLTGADDPRTIDVTPADPSCGGFDTGTVSTIHVNGADGGERVTIAQNGSAPFPHQITSSIVLALGGGTDSLVVIGQTTADTIGFGTNGVSLDADDTPDVTGVDTVEASVVDAGGGDDTVSGKEGGGLGGDFATALTLEGEEGNDALTGGAGDDAIGGGSGNDALKGAAGGDTVDGGAGDDVVSGGSANDALLGGAGADRLKGGADTDTLDGGDGGDTLSGGGGPDTVNGGDEDDRVEGGGGDDEVNGEPGRDQLSGGPGDDHCLGGPDPDSITGCEHGHP